MGELDEKYSQFDEGWDVYARRRCAAKRTGVIPANAVLPPRDERVAVEQLERRSKKLNARFMEAYAGFLE